MKFLAQDLEYDQDRLLAEVRSHERSEFDTTLWSDSRMVFSHDAERRPVRREVPGVLWDAFSHMAGATCSSRNNVVLWESWGPALGMVVSRGTVEYPYDVLNYPFSTVETMVTGIRPGGDRPDTMVSLKEYHYSR